jgi:hypothetical protein
MGPIIWFLIYLKNWVGPICRVPTNGDYEVGTRVWLSDWLGIKLGSLIKNLDGYNQVFLNKVELGFQKYTPRSWLLKDT